jgi:hypothetical protein
MKASVYKDSLHNIPELKEAVANFVRNIPPIALSHVFANKVRCVDTACVYSQVGAISNIGCKLSKYDKCICIIVHGLSEYTH